MASSMKHGDPSTLPEDLTNESDHSEAPGRNQNTMEELYGNRVLETLIV